MKSSFKIISVKFLTILGNKLTLLATGLKG